MNEITDIYVSQLMDFIRVTFANEEKIVSYSGKTIYTVIMFN